MRIVLFQPRGYEYECGNGNIRSLACVMPPVGLASIAAVLRNAGHEVLLFDAALESRTANDQWARRISREHPDLVGFTAVTSAFYDAYDVCIRVKDAAPAIATVFGGAHASASGETLLRGHPAIDCLVMGEGEFAMRDLAGGADPADIEGLVYRDGSEVQSSRPRTTLCALDDLPFPAFDLLPGFPRRYLMPLFGYPRHPGATIISSRGCVYQCSYCDRSVFGQGFRWNSPEYTFEQMRRLGADFGVRHVNFYDDLFTLNRARVTAICEKLASARLRVTFNCIVRAGHIDDELVRLLKRAGCWMVNVGIESGDQSMLDANKDGLSLSQVRSDVDRLHGAGIWVKGLFMMGFPGETETSIARTRDFACSLPLKDANVTAFTPFPGAPVTRTIRDHGVFDEDWSKMDCEHFVFVPGTIGSREILERRRAEFIRAFYSRPFMRGVYLRMLIESPHSWWRLVKSAPAFLGYARGLK